MGTTIRQSMETVSKGVPHRLGLRGDDSGKTKAGNPRPPDILTGPPGAGRQVLGEARRRPRRQATEGGRGQPGHRASASRDCACAARGHVTGRHDSGARRRGRGCRVTAAARGGALAPPLRPGASPPSRGHVSAEQGRGGPAGPAEGGAGERGGLNLTRGGARGGAAAGRPPPSRKVWLWRQMGLGGSSAGGGGGRRGSSGPC